MGYVRYSSIKILIKNKETLLKNVNDHPDRFTHKDLSNGAISGLSKVRKQSGLQTSSCLVFWGESSLQCKPLPVFWSLDIFFLSNYYQICDISHQDSTVGAQCTKRSPCITCAPHFVLHEGQKCTMLIIGE